MEIGEAVGRYEQAAALLPARWQQAARRVPEHRKAQAEEFRLRVGRPMTLATCEGEILVSDELPRDSVTQADLEQLCDAVTGYSRYAAAETMAKGYLIGRGGFRIGLCGTVVTRQDGGAAMRELSSATVRIAEKKDTRAAKPFILYETGPLGVFDAIVPEYLGGVFYGALCESVASEQAARRMAMDAATKNADEMIQDLNLRYNRARQGAITQEITEIVAGAEN